MHPGGRVDYLFLKQFGLDMWSLYPQRYLVLLENLITDGMDDERFDEWNKEMRASTTEVTEEASPMLEDMVRMKQARNTTEAAELLRLGEQMANTTNESRRAQLQDRMRQIQARAMEEAAQT